MASKLKKAAIVLSMAFMAVAIPAAGFLIESTLEADSLVNQKRDKISAAFKRGGFQDEKTVTFAEQYQNCLEVRAIPAEAAASTFEKWSQRLSFWPAAARELKGSAMEYGTLAQKSESECLHWAVGSALSPQSPSEIPPAPRRQPKRDYNA